MLQCGGRRVTGGLPALLSSLFTMSEPLTLEQLEQRAEERHTDLMTAIAGVITTVNDHMDKRFDQVEERLTTIENLVWQGERLAELERRFIKLAELEGHADLATPFMRPVGM